jgi:polysaccharide export outer membrane protein
MGLLPAQGRPEKAAKGRLDAAALGEGTAQANPQPKTENADYVIGPRDVLNISVWKEPDLSRTVPVRPDGEISLPLLNDIQVSGLTPMQLAADITKKLRKYLSDPQVSVIVEQVNSQVVYVVGEVAHPGPTPMLPNMTVLQVISIAGGLSQWANQKRIYVLRIENGQPKRYPYDYKLALRGTTGKNISLKAGDTIVVP